MPCAKSGIDIETITPANDAKLARLKGLLVGELKGKKVLLSPTIRIPPVMCTSTFAAKIMLLPNGGPTLVTHILEGWTAGLIPENEPG